MEHTTDDDTITVGAFGVRFLIEAADSNSTAAVFECSVPANARMPAPHSHDGFEGRSGAPSIRAVSAARCIDALDAPAPDA